MKKLLLLALPVALVLAGCGAKEEEQKQGCKKHRLTDEQKACLVEQGCPKPARLADGTKDPAQKAAFKECKVAAFEACGIQRKPRLTDEQKACLADQGCPKPARLEDGTKDPVAKAAFKECKADAFKACGIEKKGGCRKGCDGGCQAQ